MDGDNQKKAKNIQYLNRMKKKQNSKEINIEFLGNQGHTNELHPNQSTSEAEFIPNDIKNHVEKSAPKQKEENLQEGSEEKFQNYEVAANQMKNNGKNSKNKNSDVMKKPNQKKMNPKKSFNKKIDKGAVQTEKNELLDEVKSEAFDFEDILNNSKILELIQDLVNCFTSNSTLPENELQTLKVSFFERTCCVFLNILNNCVQKAFTSVLNSDFLQELKKEHVSKKDACCQTPFFDINESEGSQVQNIVFP